MNLNVFCMPPQQTGIVVLVVSNWARGANILRGLAISSFQWDQSDFFQDHLKNSKSPTHFACPLLHFQAETTAQVTLLAEILKKGFKVR